MAQSRFVLVLVVAVALVATAYGGYRVGMKKADSPMPTAIPAPAASGAKAADERTVLYWHDPMFPQQKFDKPGKSPFMDMELVPVYADDGASGNSVRIDPVVTQSLGVRTTLAATGTIWRKVDTVGTVQADERRITVLQSRAAGWLEKLHLRAVDDPVRRGMAVAEVYAPELLVAQEEYLLLLALPDAGEELVAAARQRLSLLGLSDTQIAEIARSRNAQRRVVLHAPSSGVVTELGAREGAAVTPGMPLARIVDLSRVWIVAQVPEAQLEWIAVGRPADATLLALAREKYEGKIEYIYPGIDTDTRTVRVRFSVSNPDAKLRPGMVASVTIWGGPKREVLLVPDEAVIRTGKRNVVIVEESQGRYRAQEVQIGLVSADGAEIIDGLRVGERIVTSGQFLIDSEASLRGAIGRLTSVNALASAEQDGHGEAADHPAPAGTGDHVAEGLVKQVDTSAGKVVIAHGPVTTLAWPPMTMGFMVSDRTILEKLKVGQTVEFHFVETDGGYRVTSVSVKGAGAAE